MGDFALNLERNLSYYGEGNFQVIINDDCPTPSCKINLSDI